MKKIVILAIAAVLVVTSLVSGVFAAYKTQLDDVSAGEVVAKDFVLVSEETKEFAASAKIAPGETSTADFTVSNYNGSRVSETDMEVTISIKRVSEIVPLTVTLKNNISGETVVLTNEANTGSLTITFTAGIQGTCDFTVTVAWPDTENDIDYINKSASYIVTATGVQK